MEFSRVGQDGHVDGKTVITVVYGTVPTVLEMMYHVIDYYLYKKVPCAVVQETTPKVGRYLSKMNAHSIEPVQQF